MAFKSSPAKTGHGERRRIGPPDRCLDLPNCGCPFSLPQSGRGFAPTLAEGRKRFGGAPGAQATAP